MKTRLCPTDFSLLADSAIHYAVKMATVFDASLILYHCFIPFESAFYPLNSSTQENLDTKTILTNHLTAIMNSIMDKNPNLSITIHVDQGPDNIKIPKFFKKNKIDLIVMGTKGASGLKEKIIGSFTAEVMTKASCPVLAIPKKYKFKIPKKITFASNYNKKDKKVLFQLLELNKLFNATITILHLDKGILAFTADEDFDNYKNTIQNHFKDFEFTFKHSTGENVAKIILEETVADKTDLIVINPLKRKGFWNRIFYSSITKKTAYLIAKPLLSIPVQ